MKHKKLIHKLLWYSLMMLAVVALVGAFLLSVSHSKSNNNSIIIPNKTEVSYQGWGRNNILSQKELLSYLPFNYNDTTPQKVDLLQVEPYMLGKTPYLKGVVAYISPANQSLHIHVAEREPVLTYFNAGGAFFLDQDGKLLPLRAGATTNVPLVTGNLYDPDSQHAALRLATYLSDQSQWHDFFGSIHVVSSHQILLYPRIGDFIFEIDGVDNLEEELEKVQIFYKKILPKVGVEKYQYIKLSYNNQIVCKLRNPSKPNS